MTLDIRLGASVASRDGTRIGTVDRLVVDPDNLRMLEIIVHKGVMFSVDRIIDRIYIDRVDTDGTVCLTIDAARAAHLPPLVEREFAVANSVDRGSTPFAVGGGPTMNQPIMWRASTVGRAMHVTGEAGYLAAVAEAAPVEVRSDLPAGAVTLNTGTVVMDDDARTIGRIAGGRSDESGRLMGFVAKAGFLHHHDITVPIDDVAAITHGYVRLRVSGETTTG
ncbi:MAG: hypothetical protein WEC79_01010 [Thermomicrobiales bacterium]